MIPTLRLYEHDSIDDLIERLKDFLADLGYDLTEIDIDDDTDEPDLYAVLEARESD